MTCRGFPVGVLFVLVLAPQWAQAAELAPINFVSSGSGGIVEVITFSQKGLLQESLLNRASSKKC